MRLKVLHIGINTSPNLAIARAFRECGHDTTSLDWKDHKATEQALSQAVVNPPDLLFMQLHEYTGVNFQHVAALKDAGTFVVDWFGDVRDPLPQCYVDRFDCVNVTACTNMPDVLDMQAMGHDARFLQVGYDELIYTPEGSAMPTPPIVFMGNNYQVKRLDPADNKMKLMGRFPLSDARAEMVYRMRQEFGKDFAVYGSGWGYGTKRLNPEQEAATYRGAKYAINFDHFDREGFHSDRYLRAMACGCPTLDATTMSIDEIIVYCLAGLESPYTNVHRACIAKDTYQTERWHNRVAVLEEWTKHHQEG